MLRSVNEQMLAIRGFSDLRYAKWPFAPIQVPIVDWILVYTIDDLKKDLLAGIIVSVLLIPQGLAFAVLAGMPPVYGLYACVVPLFVYALLGTSRQLSMGPTSITSLLLASSIQRLGYEPIDTDKYIMAVLNMSMLSGLILYSLGTLRLGALANFFNHSVLTGFITASALLVMLGQVKFIFGIHVPHFSRTHQVIIYLLSHLQDSNGYAILLGIPSWIALYMVKIWKKNNKSSPEKMKSLLFRVETLCANLSSLFAIFFGSIFAYVIVAHGEDLQIIGYVKPGFATPSFTFFDFDDLMKMLPGAAVVGFVSFALSWAAAKKFATLNGYEVDATQELIASGLTNILGSLFNSLAVASGLSRSSVAAESGGKTQVYSCIAAIIVLISLQMTFMLYYIPLPVVAAVIEVSVASLIDFEEMVKAYHVDKKDCAVMVVTFLTTFFIGIPEGVLMGIILSIAFVMNATAFPRICHLGRLPEEEGGYYKDVQRYDHAKQLPGIAIISMDTSLYFANASYFKEVVREASRGSFHSSNTPIVFIIIDVSAWHDVDLSGINILVELHADLLARNIVFGFANARGQLRDRLKTAKFIEKLGEQYIYNSIEDAVRHLPMRRQTIDREVQALETNFGASPRNPLSPSSSQMKEGFAEFRGRKRTVSGQVMFTPAYYSLASDEAIVTSDEVVNPMQFTPMSLHLPSSSSTALKLDIDDMSA
jgi:sulfate permease, SulP family